MFADEFILSDKQFDVFLPTGSFAPGRGRMTGVAGIDNNELLSFVLLMTQTTLKIPNKDIRKLNIAIGIGLMFLSLLPAGILSRLIQRFLLPMHAAETLLIPSVIFFLILCFPVVSRTKGVEIDFGQRKIREYTSTVFGTKGLWKNLDRFSALVVLSKRGKKTTVGTRLTSELEVQSLFHELYLMDENHVKRMFLHCSTSTEEIKQLVHDISIGLDIPMEKYNPKISEKRR